METTIRPDKDAVTDIHARLLRQRFSAGTPTIVTGTMNVGTDTNTDPENFQLTLGIDGDDLALLADQEVMADIAAARAAHQKAKSGREVDWDTVIREHIVD